jgi:ABC-2 type transport system ATP-binding protein
MHKSDLAISVKNLDKSFKTLRVLKGVNFGVERGSITALLGPNGAGKTTIVRILSTLLEADRGEVLVNGYDIHTQPDMVRSSIGLTGQTAAVDEYLSGRENLVLMGQLLRLSKKDAKNRAGELLKEFDLVKAADRKTKTYSGGMKRRLDIALSLVVYPPILFLDEPTTGLDPRSRIKVWSIIQKLAKSGTTVLLTTQYLEEADQLADKIMVIDGGKVIAEGTSYELKKKVGGERLVLNFSDDEELQKASQILNNHRLKIDEQQKTISFASTKGVTQLRETLELLNGIKIQEAAIRKPTLDDVFLKLTGHGAEAKASSEDDQ